MKSKRANRPTVQAVVRRWQVRHDEGPDYGLTPPDFATRGEACYRRDEWNKECPGHYVKMIEVPANAHADLPAVAGKVRRVVGNSESKKGATK